MRVVSQEYPLLARADAERPGVAVFIETPSSRCFMTGLDLTDGSAPQACAQMGVAANSNHRQFPVPMGSRSS